MILGGDIGGTSTLLALFEERDGAPQSPLVLKTFRSREYASLRELVAQFVRTTDAGPIERACFGVSGPVKNDCVETTNLPWAVHARVLAEQLGLPTVTLMNDVEANAWGIGALDAADLCVLSKGEPVPKSSAALISAGTGLGEAALFWDGHRQCPVSSEGGHVDFAPRDELEAELLIFLRNQFGRVSYERVLSGPGLVNLYKFFRQRAPGSEPEWLKDELANGDPPAVISKNALERKSSLCEQALTLMVSIYGAAAGNLALKMMATAGVYLGGGIAPKILPSLREPIFLESFRAKGRMRELLEAIPVFVILNDKTALLGTARAMRFAKTGLGRMESRP